MIGYSDATALLLGIYAKQDSYILRPGTRSSFGEFEPFVDDTYKYFVETLLYDQALPYNIKQPLFWSDEFINWEEKTKEKNLDQIIDFCNKWTSYRTDNWRQLKYNTRNLGQLFLCHVFKKAIFSLLRTVQRCSYY